MRLLYIAPPCLDFSKLDGVSKKILNQCNAFNNAQIDTDLIYYCDGKVSLYNVNEKSSSYLCRGNSKSKVLIAAYDIIKNYQCVYIRYPLSDLIFLRLLKKAKKCGLKIVVEIPTYPYDAQGLESLKGRFIHIIDKMFRRFIHNYVDRICTFSKDDIIFRTQTIRTINGIDFSAIKPDYTTAINRDKIELIAVSLMYVLHGYDRLILGLSDYYKKGGNRNIICNIIGDGPERNKYEELVQKLNLQEHVLFHGKVFGQALLDAYRGQAMGINSLAIHRENLKEESTLKTKEYAAMGLPIMSSSNVDAFSEEGNQKFVFNIPADETPVNINEMISFIDKLYSSDSVKQLRESIRENGQECCDMAVTLKSVIDFYKNS